MTGNELSLGRNHRDADSVSMTHFPGENECWRVDIKWNDGAHVYMIHETRKAALDHVHGLGWK